MKFNFKVALFAHSDVGFKIVRYIFRHYPKDISHIIVISKDEIYKFALENKIKVSIYKSEKYILSKLRNNFDVGILLWWPLIINSSIINTSNKGFINTHPSYLPFNRGKHYNFWSLVEESPFGTSIHYVNKKIDAGDILYQQKIKTSWLDNGETLFKKAKKNMVTMFKEFYPKFRKNKIKPTKQNLSRGSYHNYKEIDKKSYIDLSKKYLARDIINLIRARTFKGNPGCYFKDKGEVFEIRTKITKKIKSL